MAKFEYFLACLLTFSVAFYVFATNGVQPVCGTSVLFVMSSVAAVAWSQIEYYFLLKTWKPMVLYVVLFIANLLLAAELLLLIS